MPDLLSLPTELLHLIVDELDAGESEGDLSSLSLTCQSLLLPCREHIFSSISLHTPSSISTLSVVVDANPLISHYVTRLSFALAYHAKLPNKLTASLLNSFDHLQDLTLTGMSKGFDILDLEPTLPKSIISLIASSIHLRRLRLLHWQIPTQLFSFCNVNLELLDLEEVVLYEACPTNAQRLSHLNALRSDTQRTLMSIRCGLGTHDIHRLHAGKATATSGSTLDLSHLKSLSVTFCGGEDNLNARFLLQIVENPESLYVTVFEWEDGALGLSTMMKPSTHSTLKKLTLSETVEGLRNVTPCNVHEELVPFTSLRELHLDIKILPYDYDCNRHLGKDWEKLDMVLSNKYSGESMSLRLTIQITIWGEELKAWLERIPEQHLTRIVQNKNIEFVFSICNMYNP